MGNCQSNRSVKQGLPKSKFNNKYHQYNGEANGLIGSTALLSETPTRDSLTSIESKKFEDQHMELLKKKIHEEQSGPDSTQSDTSASTDKWNDDFVDFGTKCFPLEKPVCSENMSHENKHLLPFVQTLKAKRSYKSSETSQSGWGDEQSSKGMNSSTNFESDAGGSFFAANSNFDTTHERESVMSSNMGSTFDDSILQHHTVIVWDDNLDEFEKFVNMSPTTVQSKTKTPKSSTSQQVDEEPILTSVSEKAAMDIPPTPTSEKSVEREMKYYSKLEDQQDRLQDDSPKLSDSSNSSESSNLEEDSIFSSSSSDERENDEDKNNLALIVSNIKVNQYYIEANESRGLGTSGVVVTPANEMEQKLMNEAQPKYCEDSIFGVQAAGISSSIPPPPPPPPPQKQNLHHVSPKDISCSSPPSEIKLETFVSPPNDVNQASFNQSTSTVPPPPPPPQQIYNVVSPKGNQAPNCLKKPEDILTMKDESFRKLRSPISPPNVFMPEIKTRETSETSKFCQEMYLSPPSSYEEEYEDENADEMKENTEEEIEEENEKENNVHVKMQHTKQSLNSKVSNDSEQSDKDDNIREQSILSEISTSKVSSTKSSPNHKLNEELGYKKDVTPTNEIRTTKINYLQERFQNNQLEASKSRTKLKEILSNQKNKNDRKDEVGNLADDNNDQQSSKQGSETVQTSRESGASNVIEKTQVKNNECGIQANNEQKTSLTGYQRRSISPSLLRRTKKEMPGINTEILGNKEKTANHSILKDGCNDQMGNSHSVKNGNASVEPIQKIHDNSTNSPKVENDSPKSDVSQQLNDRYKSLTGYQRRSLSPSPYRTKKLSITQENNNSTLGKASPSPVSSTNEARVDENKKHIHSKWSTEGLSQEILTTTHRRRGRTISQSPRRHTSKSTSVSSTSISSREEVSSSKEKEKVSRTNSAISDKHFRLVGKNEHEPKSVDENSQVEKNTEKKIESITGYRRRSPSPLIRRRKSISPIVEKNTVSDPERENTSAQNSESKTLQKSNSFRSRSTRRKSGFLTTDKLSSVEKNLHSNTIVPQDTDSVSIYSSCSESSVATKAEVMIQRLKSHRELFGAGKERVLSGQCQEQVITDESKKENIDSSNTTSTSVRTKADDAISRMKALSSQEPHARIRSRTLTSKTEPRHQRGEKDPMSNTKPENNEKTEDPTSRNRTAYSRKNRLGRLVST